MLQRGIWQVGYEVSSVAAIVIVMLTLDSLLAGSQLLKRNISLSLTVR